jgi:hypothetical protein
MPSYSELRTFGCACYPYLRPYEDHKLAFRSKQCIFIGYVVTHFWSRTKNNKIQKKNKKQKKSNKKNIIKKYKQ